MSSDNNGTGDDPKKMSPDIMKKLNDAFSSYLDGKGAEKVGSDDSEKDLLLELVREGIAEKQQQQAADHSSVQAGSDELGESDENTFDLVEDAGDCPVNEKEAVISVFNDKVPDVLSGVFDDVQYQSVELEVTEIEDTDKADEDLHYSEVAAEILKKKSKDVGMSVPVENISNNPVVLSADEKPSATLPVKEIPSAALPVNDKPISKEPALRSKLEKAEDGVVVVSRAFVKKAPVSAKIPAASKKSEKAKAVNEVSSQKASIAIKENGKAINAEESVKESLKKPVTPNVVAPAVSRGPVNIAFLYNKNHTSHDATSLSMHTHERPERLIKAMWYLEKNKVFEDGTCELLEKFDMADEADILRVHNDSYVSFVRNYSISGGGFLGDSTYMTKTSYDIARMAIGAAIEAGNLIMDKKFPYAFVMARPPGHHASTEKYGGFCLFNNAGILARYLQKKRNVGRVLILDWDAHAGDGTMEIFYEDPTVMLLSLHRDPHGFYPRKGFSTQIGENAGKGYTLNVEMPEGSGNEEYSMAFDEVIIPAIQQFSPELIIVSCGFDAYYKEKNIGLTLDSDGYHQMTSKVLSVFGRPMIFLMEGGYHDFNGQLCHSVLSALHGRPNPVSDKQEISSYKMNLRKKIFEDTQKKVEESKKNNPFLFSKVTE